MLLRLLQIFSLILAGALAGCGSDPYISFEEIFPPTGAVPDWMKESATSVYDASDLWKYLGGDAPRYTQAGLVVMLTSGYRFKLVSDAEVDVYVMNSTTGAREVYESEPAVGSKALNIGDAGQYSQGRVTFRQGAYLVRVAASDNLPELTPALVALAFAVSERLPRENRKP